MGPTDTAMNVFILFHTAIHPENGEDVKLIGVFSSRSRAEKAIDQKKNEKGFCDHPNGFHIDELTVDRVQWSSGFGIGE